LTVSIVSSHFIEFVIRHFKNSISASLICFVMAVATLLTVQGQQVVATGKRRWVDSHWQRGNSYLKMGWNWVKGVLRQGWTLFYTFSLSGHPDPEPAFASQKQKQKCLERGFTAQSYRFVS
jgi:hypothetical protein